MFKANHASLTEKETEIKRILKQFVVFSGHAHYKDIRFFGCLCVGTGYERSSFFHGNLNWFICFL